MANNESREEGGTGGGSQVYLWHGYQNLSPRSFDIFSQTAVIKVSIGAKHCAFLTRDLEVYTYGNNQHGQLGNGTFTDSLKEPVLVEGLKDQEVLDISCGATHTGAVTFGGDVYCWGDSTSGQCGIGQVGRFPEPRLVKITETLTPCTHSMTGEEMRVTVAQISCGELHTCVVSDVGEIWSWGSGVQLGLNKLEKALAPQKIEYLEGRQVLSVSCGGQHTLALVEKLKTPSDRKSPSSESGRSSDSGLSSRSVTGLSICRSRSGSPIVNNSIQLHRARPSTCLKCQQDIYTYTETSDACIISTQHKCPLGLRLEQDAARQDGVKQDGVKLDSLKQDSLKQDSLKQDRSTPSESSETEGGSSKSGRGYNTKEEGSGNDDSSCTSTPDRKPLEVSINEQDNKVINADDNNEVINTEEFEDLSTELMTQHNEMMTQHNEVMTQQKEMMTQHNEMTQQKEVMTQQVNSTEPVTLRVLQRQGTDRSESDMTDSEAGDMVHLDYVKLDESPHKEPQAGPNLLQSDLGLRRGHSPEPLRSPEVQQEDVLTQQEDVLTDLLRGSRRPGQPGGAAITKSKSAFLDEHEAKETLEKLLYGGQEEAGPGQLPPGQDQGSPSSPFVKNIENILQYVPSSPAAVQEYVTTLTKNVVSNIKTSIDRFSFVSAHNSMELDSLSKSSSQDSINLAAGSKTPKEESSLSRSKVEGHHKVKDHHDLWFGSMTRSTSLGSFLKAKMNAERKVSLSSGELNLFKVGASCPPVPLETEVWSWGRGRHGQLGHGDILDRRTPCCVGLLSDLRVIKVTAGSYHSAVVTANSQVYTWGSQSDGQLGHTDPSSSLPQKVKAPVGGQPMWDVAAGHAHTTVTMDATSFTPDVLYTGKQPSTEKAETEKTTQLLRLSAIRKCGWIKQVVAGGDLCGCLTDRNTTGYTATLHELAASERLYHCRLHTMMAAILRPFLLSEHFKKLDNAMYEGVFKTMIDAFQQIIDAVARNTIELTKVIQGQRELETLTFLAQPEDYLSIFQTYSKQFGDVLALGGFEHATKNASAFFEKVHEHFVDVLDETRVEKSNMALTLRRLMQVPLHRLKDYSKLSSKIALRYPSYTSEHMHLTQLSTDWDTLKQSASSEHTSAENTRKFWETCPPKFADALKVPGRRLVRESKANPLSMPTSGRFSMHWFILFSDVFVHGQYSMHQTFPLPTIWVEPVQDTNQVKSGMSLTMPEEMLILTTPTATEKAEWLWGYNEAIDKALSDQKQLIRPRIDGARLTPPLSRQATHVFYKNPQLKDAKYVGMWLAGKLHGHGELTWPDGRRYQGKFKQGMQHGHGVYSVPKDGETEVYDGHWKDGKMHGLGNYKYCNGDVYEGYFKEGKKHGHGVLRRGKITSGAPPEASIYIGEWVNDKKCGYGVLDDISKGQKYMGMWQDDSRHGNGIIVTLDCMYFEGTFTHDKMTGFGLLMTEDNSCYEGDFSGGPNLHGKGTLTLPNGDFIEGHFSGSFTEGIKIKDGMFRKAEEPLNERRGFTHSLGLLPTSFGKLSVGADSKWEDIFRHCYSILGCQDGQTVDSGKAWETVAVMVCNGRKALKDDSKRSRAALEVLEELEKIPRQGDGSLTLQQYLVMLNYLTKAFETPFHPLGKLMEGLVDVYRATYMGIGAHHPRLLTHAVAEVKSYVKRIYPLVRLLFPSLPEDHRQLFPEEYGDTGDEQDDDGTGVIITPGSLIYPLLLPKIYPPLFTLYALYNEREDERYWKRLTQWNKQSDMGLMASLGMDQKFWLIDESILTSRQQLSSAKDKCYREATETLQHISTSFSPAEKLKTIKQTFNAINKEVQSWLGLVQWCMDELFPVFLFVVVRAGIRHLGAEIHFIDDLMEPHLEHGELGIMFTTLKACYHQIQIEKI